MHIKPVANGDGGVRVIYACLVDDVSLYGGSDNRYMCKVEVHASPSLVADKREIEKWEPTTIGGAGGRKRILPPSQLGAIPPRPPDQHPMQRKASETSCSKTRDGRDRREG